MYTYLYTKLIPICMPNLYRCVYKIYTNWIQNLYQLHRKFIPICIPLELSPPLSFYAFINVWQSSIVHYLLPYQFVYIHLLSDPLCATHLQGILTCHTIDLPWPLASEHFQTIEQLRQTSSYMPSVTPHST